MHAECSGRSTVSLMPTTQKVAGLSNKAQQRGTVMRHSNESQNQGTSVAMFLLHGRARSNHLQEDQFHVVHYHKDQFHVFHYPVYVLFQIEFDQLIQDGLSRISRPAVYLNI